jgi:uncharacterized protein
MTTPPENCHINYIELNVRDLEKAKAFYGQAFGWTFTDYGPQYAEFSDQLEAAQGSVMAAGGAICREIYPFPGGRRFHFKDADGYELAVWSKT